MEKSSKYLPTPKIVLSELFDKYMEFVQEELTFDSMMKEIPDFGEWASAHHNIPKKEAEDFFYDYEEGDGATTGARAA